MPPSRSSSFILEGDYADGVLGQFKIIRGFATLQDLASISVAFEMNAADAEAGELSGHQRVIDETHAESIKKYLQGGKPRFIPEIILSVRADYTKELDDQSNEIGVICKTPNLWIRRKYNSKNIRTHQIAVSKDRIETVVKTDRRIRRIDGNHRLHLAHQLPPDPAVASKYLAPFCAILLASPGDANDDYVESMIFHTINNKAVPLDSEHALKLVLGQAAKFRATSEEEFSSDPALHLTRLLKNKIDLMPPTQQRRLGRTPATVLNSAASALVGKSTTLALNRSDMVKYANELSGAITDILARLPANHPELCKADFFIELASLAWSDTDPTQEPDLRINQAVVTLEGIGRWLGRDGMHRIQSKRSIAQQLMEIYRSVQSRVPKKVFLARWYPMDSDKKEKTRADLRLAELKKATDSLGLELIDMGTKEGGTYQIPTAMYDAIDSSEIMLADMTGIRPNVMIEIGFALRGHRNGRMLLFYDSRSELKVPFDIAGFQYIEISDAAEIHTKLKPSIETIIDQAKAALI